MKQIILSIRNLLLAAGLIAAVSLIAAPAISYADTRTDICEGIGMTGGTCEGGGGESTLSDTIKDVINIISILVGFVAVVMIIVSGLKYVTSGGDAGKVNSAKDSLLFAVIGLVIVALAQFIVRFVLARVKPS